MNIYWNKYRQELVQINICLHAKFRVVFFYDSLATMVGLSYLKVTRILAGITIYQRSKSIVKNLKY